MKVIVLSLVFLSSCGLTVVRPNENAGMKALDYSEGGVKLVDTYTCSIVASNGKRVSAVEKSEQAAKDEAMARCRDQTIISICRPENLRCVKN